MTIENIKLTDKFHVWVAATNLILEEINREIVLEAKQKLKTLNKSTLVAAINELYDSKLNKNENISLINNDIVAKNILANTKIQIGNEGNKNSFIEFYDDNENLYRKFLYDSVNQKWYAENKNGELKEVLTTSSVIDGNLQDIILKRLPDKEFNTYTGKEGTLSYNLITKKVKVHDGFTAGGIDLVTSDEIITDKVKLNEDDLTSDYLDKKIIAGKGINFTKDTYTGNHKLVIENKFMDEFSNAIANTYIKRNEKNDSYIYLNDEQVRRELDVIKTYTKTKPFSNVIALENNIKIYTTTISSDTEITFNNKSIYYDNVASLFEIVIDLISTSKISFNNNLKWDKGMIPAFDSLGKYIIQIRTFDGNEWLGKLIEYYPA